MEIMDTIRVWTGSGQTVEDMKKVKMILGNAEKLLKKARDYGLEMNPTAAAEFRKHTNQLDGVLTNISKALSTGDSLYQAYEDAMKIKTAMEVLGYNDGEIMRYNPEGAVTAFGVMFVGLGGFVSHMPVVGKYGEVLKCAGNSLCKVYKMLDPLLRQGWGGPQLKQLHDEGLKMGTY